MKEILVPDTAHKIPRDYEGHIFISDIDKTYIASEIDSFIDLLKTAFETPERKSNIPGFSILLRALRRGALEQAAEKPIFFISASPPQLESRLLAKMELDGIEHNGIIFKNQIENVKKAKFRKLREQIGYKLQALLSLWIALPQKSKLVLFGDDSESDAAIYSLFRDILAGHVEGKNLMQLLGHLGVFREECVQVAWLARKIKKPVYPVQAVYINLITGSQVSYYNRFGSLFNATENTLQAALSLYEAGLVRDKAIVSIGRDLKIHHDFEPNSLMRSLVLAARRGVYSMETLQKILPQLESTGVVASLDSKVLEGEGELSRLHPLRWSSNEKPTLQELKKRYSQEGRY